MQRSRRGSAGTRRSFESDPTLQHPRCVFQVLKRHFARYTPEMVERFCGVPKDVFLKAAEISLRHRGRRKPQPSAMRWDGRNTPRAFRSFARPAILQLLLGNIGRPGGGILALRGHASIQGSTDIPTLYDILPGYLPMPFFEADSNKLKDFIKKHRARDRFVGQLRQIFHQSDEGILRRRRNQGKRLGFQLAAARHRRPLALRLLARHGGRQNRRPVCDGPEPRSRRGQSGLERTALSKLKWLVVRDMVEIETASFWYDSPEVERGELSPETLARKFFSSRPLARPRRTAPSPTHNGCCNTAKKQSKPPGDAAASRGSCTTWECASKRKRCRALPRNDGLRALTWDYSTKGPQRRTRRRRSLTGNQWISLGGAQQLKAIQEIKKDGSTACGAWIYCGVFPDKNRNRANERNPKDFLGHGWGFSWPNDCRIIYNRASARPDGKPWSERKKLIWWDEEKKQWTGLDTPDY